MSDHQQLPLILALHPSITICYRSHDITFREHMAPTLPESCRTYKFGSHTFALWPNPVLWLQECASMHTTCKCMNQQRKFVCASIYDIRLPQHIGRKKCKGSQHLGVTRLGTVRVINRIALRLHSYTYNYLIVNFFCYSYCTRLQTLENMFSLRSSSFFCCGSALLQVFQSWLTLPLNVLECTAGTLIKMGNE